MFDLSTTEGVIGGLTLVLTGVVGFLKKRIDKHEKDCAANEARCIKNEEQSRKDAQACHDKIENLLTSMVTNAAAAANRQEALMHAVHTSLNHNTQAVAGFASSGEHPAITKNTKRKRR